MTTDLHKEVPLYKRKLPHLVRVFRGARYINPARQAKKKVCREFGITNKKLHRLIKQSRRTRIPLEDLLRA
jgi:hypothetical protein